MVYGSFSAKFVRIDRFFCQKCLHTEEKRQEGSHRDTPDWYKGGDEGDAAHA